MNVTNEPLPFRSESRFHSMEAGNNVGFQLAFNLSFAMSFVVPFFITRYIKERVTKAKLMQFISGANELTYWGTAFICDYLKFVVLSLVTLAILFMFQESGWATADEFGRIFLVFLCLGLVTLPVLYMASHIFSSAATGYIGISIFFIFSGAGLFATTYTMLYEGFNLHDTALSMKRVFVAIFPFFAFSDAISNIHVVNVVNQVCQMQCSRNLMCKSIADLCQVDRFEKCCQESDYFGFHSYGIGRHLLGMLSGGLIQFTVLLVMTFRFHKFFKPRNRVISSDSCRGSDPDVTTEAMYVQKLDTNSLEGHNLILKNMTKYYGKFRAVSNLNLAVNGNECFGLLGINGAGKTSTFKMLIGDKTISTGDAWVNGVSIKLNPKSVHQRIGYCPQFDALIDDLTGREVLEYFCSLRGIPRKDISNVVNKLADALNLSQHIDRLAQNYSGGNKRKLSTAVALVGDPLVVYLDEPTAGMDLCARKHFWHVINRLRNEGRSIVLTSHSMEECEVLCTRLAIMVDGEFQCLGSVQYLKSKFSADFIVKVKYNGEDLRPRNEIHLDFPSAVLINEFGSILTYQIGAEALKWSTILRRMEEMKTRGEIEDYTINQISLEQVFLAFVGEKSQSTRL